MLSCVEINPDRPARASVIWLHGLGADGHDFEPIVRELGLGPASAIRFVFPHAPTRPVTINQGYVMRAWYDVARMDLSQEEDEASIRSSEGLVRELVQRETQRGIPIDRIMLAGFSQGGAVAIHTGLRYPERLAGILVLSAYVPLASMLASEAYPANADVPIMMAHGSWDNVIPIRLAQTSRDLLTRLGYRVRWHTYTMEHGLCAQEVADISEWMKEVCPSRLG
jgi:phospholipase/carboxylesterase